MLFKKQQSTNEPPISFHSIQTDLLTHIFYNKSRLSDLVVFMTRWFETDEGGVAQMVSDTECDPNLLKPYVLDQD